MLKLFRVVFKPFHEGFKLWQVLRDHTSIIEALRIRIIVSCVFSVVTFGAVIFRLCDVMILRDISKPQIVHQRSRDESRLKADIVDRNGNILATCIVTASCYADPSLIEDLDQTVENLSKISCMPSKEVLKKRLQDKNKRFVWLARHIIPKNQQEIMNLKLPGILFRKDYKRVYPYGNLFSHVVGFSDTDSNGSSGIEKQFDEELEIKDIDSKNKLVLTLDTRVQSIVREELAAAVEKFHAVGGNAMVMNMKGEIIAMVSLPDFDPNNLKKGQERATFNRNSLGVYEPGSTFKILNTAIALESGSANLGTMFDATSAIKIGRFSVTDFKGKNRALSLAEAFVFSSNIAAIKIAQKFGIKTQKAFMKKFGILDKCNLEIPEVGKPIVPRDWREATSMTISYGYGMAVTPLQLLTSVTSIVNNGWRIKPTLLYQVHQSSSDQIVSEKTSENMRELMRAVVCFGTAKRAMVEGVEIFGKTGTAYKNAGKGYGNASNRGRITTFIGGFSKKKPQYMLLLMLDDPKSIEETHGYATAGWNAAPTAGKIFQKIIPLVMEASEETEETTGLKVTKYIQLN